MTSKLKPVTALKKGRRDVGQFTLKERNKELRRLCNKYGDIKNMVFGIFFYLKNQKKNLKIEAKFQPLLYGYIVE